MKNKIIILALVLCTSSLLMAYSSLVGFSGAPGSNGTCAQSCHTQQSFTPSCEISGFPASYNPGQQYTLTIRHTDGPSICQFNCSVRADEDSSVAGQLSIGMRTALYTTANEIEGIHWQETYNDSGTFTWIAPEAHTGPVTMYWAGLQGNRSSGADQQIVFHASEEPSSIDYIAEKPEAISLEQNYPNPFNQSTAIDIWISQPGDITLEVSNILGQRIDLISIANAEAGHYRINWNGLDSDGRELPSGMYFYQLRSPEGNLTRKMTLLR